MSKFVKFIVRVAATESCNVDELEDRVYEHLEKLANPKREDEGILEVLYVITEEN